MKPRTLALTVVAGLVIAGGLIWGGYAALKYFSPTERALSELRALPLVGLLLSEVPDAEQRLRQAIAEEQREPTTSGPPRPVVAIAELRREYIVPVLRGADDATAIATVAARAGLVAHLQKTNLPACREFAVGGIQHVDKLDPEGQRLFGILLKTIEAAYRNSRANGATPQPMPNRQQVVDMLREAGFQKVDFDRLNAFVTLSNEVSCEVELKVDQLPPTLPADKRGPFARFIIAN